MALTEYEPGAAFPGVIGRTTDESSPAWPRPLRAAAGSPNVLFIVLDDTSFGQLGCYGSPIARRIWIRWPLAACCIGITCRPPTPPALSGAVKVLVPLAAAIAAPSGIGWAPPANLSP